MIKTHYNVLRDIVYNIRDLFVARADLPIYTLYQPAMIVSPLQPDNPSKAKPSDHLVPILYPISGQSGLVPRQYRTKTSRPLPESGIREFGNWLVGESWLEIEEQEGPDKKVEKFTEKFTQKLNHIFPEKKGKS